MASLSTTTASGETYVIYVSPISTSVGATFTIFSTIYYTDPDGKTTASLTYLPQSTTLYTTVTSLATTPTPTYDISTIKSESLISIYYVPVSTLRTLEDGETVSSVLYGTSDNFTAFTTYVTAISLSTTSSISPVRTSISPSSNSTVSSAPASLSTGAKAGIGIGVTLAIFIVGSIVLGWFLVRRRRKASPQLTEVAPVSHRTYDKPELDATEVPVSSAGHTSYGKSEKAVRNTSESPLYDKTGRSEFEVDATGKLKADGRAELEGRMVPKADVIRRKEVGSVKARSMVDDKEVLREV